MSKGQFENWGAKRGPESGFMAPEDITIGEMVDKKHPNHAFYAERLSPKDPDMIEMVAAMREVGWPDGSIAFLWKNGKRVDAATARRRITAARIENERRRVAKDKRGQIVVPFLWTQDPVGAEAIENAGRKEVPPMQLARDFVALRDALGSETKAAARLVLPLTTAHYLEACLSLPVDIQGQVNRREIPVDVAGRMAKKGSDAARTVVDASKDKSGKVDGEKARAAAKDLPKRPKAIKRADALALAATFRESTKRFSGQDVAAAIQLVLGDGIHDEGVTDAAREMAEQAKAKRGQTEAAE